MKYQEVIKKFKALSDPEAVAAMARFGINPKKNFGLTVAAVRKMAKEIGRDHKLAQQLWASGTREARMLACLIEELEKVTEKQVDRWVKDFDSWDVCDHACGNLFDRTPFAYKKVVQWSRSKEEFVKRAAFALMAWLAVHDKQATDEKFLRLMPLIKRASRDDRNYVKKAVNWALRHIGKRNLRLNKKALQAAREIKKIDSKAARWIATDAIRELTDKKVIARIRNNYRFTRNHNEKV